MTTFLERINAVLHHQPPDQVPFAPYDNLVPRGAFEREMRNRGMGLCLRRASFWSEHPHVRVETRTDGDVTTTTYHTPVGSLSTRYRAHVSREYSEGRSVEIEGLIKCPGDIEAAIAMIDDTVYHLDHEGYDDPVRDVGEDGIVRGVGLEGPAYDWAIGLFGYSNADGLANWAYVQQDYPDRFAALLEALERRNERLFPLIADSPAQFVSMGSLSGLYGPREYVKYALPFYQKYVPLLHERGKICSLHAHAANLKGFKELVRETGVDVVEAFTPPAYGDLSLAEARAAWGPETVIWINIPETIFWSGPDVTRRYVADLLRSDVPGGALVIGFTEAGLACVVSDEVERTFKAGFRAVMEAIEEHGNYPIGG